MNHDAYAMLRVSREDGIVRVTLDNPPVNVLNVALMTELRHLLTALRDDESVRVIVFDSADPEFFIAHVDMTLVDTPDAFDELAADLPDGVNVFQALGELLRHQPQVTIVKLAGMARGGGAEFVTAADMAFAAIGRAGIGQIEALMGIVPGGGGTQYLVGRVGRNRALEVVLSADLYDAETAERYGWVNRAVPAGERDLEGLLRGLAGQEPDEAPVLTGALSTATACGWPAAGPASWATGSYRGGRRTPTAGCSLQVAPCPARGRQPARTARGGSHLRVPCLLS
ncbi:enoyl-CoA hydratase/isomerase family protein [Streptomyces melanogenes]|uniref:enoyl-CoA hydratase/isomerase family protein n=1 Tax=Streptomyces melanogenes TaxID=67326 RepID=UPI0037A56904